MHVCMDVGRCVVSLVCVCMCLGVVLVDNGCFNMLHEDCIVLSLLFYVVK